MRLNSRDVLAFVRCMSTVFTESWLADSDTSCVLAVTVVGVGFCVTCDGTIDEFN